MRFIVDESTGTACHTYQLLTKRSQRLLERSGDLPWPPNVWMGVTVESDAYRFRVDHLRRTGAQCRFLSLEPLLGPLPKLDLSGIHWVIVGGESGPGARPLQEDWVLDIRDQCGAAQAPFFFKQWGGVRKKRAGRMLEGRTWDAMLAMPGARRPGSWPLLTTDQYSPPDGCGKPTVAADLGSRCARARPARRGPHPGWQSDRATGEHSP